MKNLELRGIAFQSQTSCLLLPGRLRALRCILHRNPSKAAPFQGSALRFNSQIIQLLKNFLITEKIIHL